MAEVAQHLRVSTAAVYRRCNAGELPHVRISNAIRVSPAELGAFLAGNRRGSSEGMVRIRTGMEGRVTEALTPAGLAEAIHVVRGQRVMADADLARLYGVTTKRLNEQVRRNLSRFPPDFSFVLTSEEYLSLRSQNATLEGGGRGQHRKYLPRAFTEHGAVMAASVLNSPKAVEMTVFVVRAFVRLRSLLAANRGLATKLDELERKYALHDRQIAAILQAVRELMVPPGSPRRRVGFALRKE